MSKVVLITGTSRGLGKFLIDHYLDRGFTVLGCSRSLVSNERAGYHHYCLDIGDSKASAKLFVDIRKVHKRLDILINNAAVFSKNLVAMTTDSAIVEMVDTNLKAAMVFSREACRIMQRNGFGRIVNISSIAVPLKERGAAVYAASKAALEHFGEVLAREVYGEGITVNNVSLSLVKGSGMLELLSSEVREQMLARTVAGQYISMDDVVHAIDFLIDERSKNITAQTICVGGV